MNRALSTRKSTYVSTINNLAVHGQLLMCAAALFVKQRDKVCKSVAVCQPV
jgi:hypothetical protein